MTGARFRGPGENMPRPLFCFPVAECGQPAEGEACALLRVETPTSHPSDTGAILAACAVTNNLA